MKKSIAAALMAFIAIGIFALFKGVHAQELDYTVQAGDSLSSIAASQLGDANKWEDIYTINKASIANPNVIYQGQVLQLPGKVQGNVASTLPVASSPTAQNVITQNVVENQVPVYAYTRYQVVSTQENNNYGSNWRAYQSLIAAAASKYGVDAGVMNKIISCESGYNPNAYNPSGATGIAQFMPGTYYGSWNPYKNQYPITSPVGQIYAMALKIHLGGISAWTCARNL